MSKIQTNIVLKTNIPTNNNNFETPKVVPKKSHHPQPTTLSLQSRMNHRLQFSPFRQASPKVIKNNTHKEDYQVRFSRFCCWRLPETNENVIVDKYYQQNYFIENEQKQNSLIGQQQQSACFFTPYTAISTVKNSYNPKISKQIFNTFQNMDELFEKKFQHMMRPKQTGLRKLSSKAFQIVKQLGLATYKDVATKLIKQALQEEGNSQDIKEQNNIKRRVYDALNVLIAMKILKKVGKNIVYQPNETQQKLHLAYRQKKQELTQQFQRKRKALLKKKQMRKELIQKSNYLAQLTNRNKMINLELSKNIVKKQQAAEKVQQYRIQFPFIFVMLPQNTLVSQQIIQKTMIKQQSQNRFRIILNKQCSVFQDSDILQKIFSQKAKSC